MASPLTWRNVDAPNMSGSLDGIRTTANLLGDATKDLSAGLAGFGQAQQDQAGGIALQNAMKYTDPNAYAAALQSGELLQGVDPSKVSPQVLAQLSQRSGDLLTNQWKSNQNRATDYDFTRAQDQNSALDAASPILNQITAAQAQGNTALVNQLRQDNAGVLNGLTADQMAAATRGNVGLQSSILGNQGAALDNVGKGIGNASSAFNYGNAVQDRSEGRDAAVQTQNIMSNSIDAASARRNYESLPSNLSPTEKLIISQQLGSAFPELKGTLNVGGSGNSLQQTSGMTLGGGQLDPNIKTVGDLVDNKAALVKQNGGSPFGTYQVTGDTWADFAPKVLGSDWRSADPRDPDVQDKIGKAIWDSTGGNAGKIKGRWDALSASDAERVKGMSWDDVKPIIAAKESGTDPSTFMSPAQFKQKQVDDGLKNDLVTKTLNQTIGGKNIGTLNIPEYFKSVTDQMSTAEIANTMASNSKALKGASAQWIGNQMEQIREQSGGKLSYPQAAVVLENSAKFQSNGLGSSIGNTWRNFTGADNAGYTVNQQGMDSRINQALTGAPIEQSFDTGRIAADRDNVQSTFEAYQKAGQALQALQQQQVSGRQIDPQDVQRYQQLYATADQNYRNALNRAQTPDNLPNNVIQARQDVTQANNKREADALAKKQSRDASQKQVPARVIVSPASNILAGISQEQLDQQSAPGRQLAASLNYRPPARQ